MFACVYACLRLCVQLYGDCVVFVCVSGYVYVVIVCVFAAVCMFVDACVCIVDVLCLCASLAMFVL